MTKTCSVCGKDFVVTRGRRYCSAACARIANNTNRANLRKAAALTEQAARESRQVMREKRDRAYEALGVRTTTSVVNGRMVEWRGQKVFGMNSTWGRARY